MVRVQMSIMCSFTRVERVRSSARKWLSPSSWDVCRKTHVLYKVAQTYRSRQ